MMFNFNIERIVMPVLAVIILFTVTFYAGKMSEREKWQSKIDKQTVKVAVKEGNTAAKVEGATENYEKKFKELEAKFVKLGFDFGRLRVPTRCPMPKAGTNPAASTGTNPPERPIDGPGTGEINLDGVAAKVIQLGRDLDYNLELSNAKVEYLQDLLVTYQKACTVQ